MFTQTKSVNTMISLTTYYHDHLLTVYYSAVICETDLSEAVICETDLFEAVICETDLFEAV